MSSTKATLLAIAVFLLLIVGSFIWFIATWDASKKESITGTFPVVKTEVPA